MNKKLFLGLVLSSAVFLSAGCAAREPALTYDPYWVGGLQGDEDPESPYKWIPFIETSGSNQAKLPDERSPAIDGRSSIREDSGGYETSPFARKRKYHGTVPPGIH